MTERLTPPEELLADLVAKGVSPEALAELAGVIWGYVEDREPRSELVRMLHRIGLERGRLLADRERRG